MPIFENLFGKRGAENPEDPDKVRAVGEEQSRAINQSPQEPILPGREALEAEAKELFILKEKPLTAVSAQNRPTGEAAPYTGDAETTSPPPLEAAMTKARTDVLDLLSRIEKAGLPISPELKAQVKDELTNLAAEAARVEFQEAQQTNPIAVLNEILRKLLDQYKGRASDPLLSGARVLDENLEEFFRRFRREQQTLIQKGISEPSNEEIIAQVVRPFGNQQYQLTSIGFFGQDGEYRTVTEQLLAELSVYSGGKPLLLDDLFGAIRNTGRREPNGELPYYITDRNATVIVGLRSTLPEFKGLSVNVVQETGLNNPRIEVLLRGNADFWLRVIENQQALT